MNNLYQQLNKTTGIPANIKQAVANIKMLANPQAAAQKALNENPQLRSLIQAANGDPEKAFRNLAAKMNVNPDEVINMLR